MSALLDTHVWIWWLTPGSPLTAREHRTLDAHAERRELYTCAISLSEAQMLHAKNQLELAMPIGWNKRRTSGCWVWCRSMSPW